MFSCFPANSKAAASTKDRATVGACVDQIGVVQSAMGRVLVQTAVPRSTHSPGVILEVKQVECISSRQL
jgi:hypothetical protein